MDFFTATVFHFSIFRIKFSFTCYCVVIVVPLSLIVSDWMFLSFDCSTSDTSYFILYITCTKYYIYILNAKKPAPGKDIKIVEKNGNVKV